MTSYPNLIHCLSRAGRSWYLKIGMVKPTASQNRILKALSNPRYKGRHLVIVKNKVFSAQTGQQAAKLFKEVTTKYPQEKPTITYVPKEETLILWLE